MGEKIFNTKIKAKPRILFDMDDVIVEYAESVINDYNIDNNTNHKIENLKEWELKSLLGDSVHNYLNSKNRFIDLKIKKEADKAIKDIIDTNRYDVFIVTACEPTAYVEKAEWLKRYMPFFNIQRLIPAVEKTAIWGDILVDDKIENLKKFDRLIGNSIVFDAPYNRENDDFIRINNLKELLPIIDKMFYDI